jgi:Protein of unknown function (DUF2844)
MTICSTKSACVLAALGMSALWTGSARGALGSDAASVLADGASMHVGIQSELRPQYEVLTISTAAGISVREYLNQDGIVFAVNWSGPVPADLQQLLGAHFATYAAAVAAVAHPGIHRSLRLESSGLIVELGGHLRAYSGRAYLAALIPSGLTAEEFQ